MTPNWPSGGTVCCCYSYVGDAKPVFVPAGCVELLWFLSIIAIMNTWRMSNHNSLLMVSIEMQSKEEFGFGCKQSFDRNPRGSGRWAGIAHQPSIRLCLCEFSVSEGKKIHQSLLCFGNSMATYGCYPLFQIQAIFAFAVYLPPPLPSTQPLTCSCVTVNWNNAFSDLALSLLAWD